MFAFQFPFPFMYTVDMSNSVCSCGPPSLQLRPAKSAAAARQTRSLFYIGSCLCSSGASVDSESAYDYYNFLQSP